MTKLGGSNALLCYLDEAGNTHFDSTGSRFFLYTALVLTTSDYPLHSALLECRYRVIAELGRFSNSHEGNDYFHATEDSLETRNRVFPLLKDHETEARVYSLVVEKTALPPEMQTQGGLFEFAATNLLREIWRVEFHPSLYDRMLVMLDSIPVQKRRRAIIGAIKGALRNCMADTGASFSVMPIASKSDLCLQAVDYYSWALYRKWESGDPTQIGRLGSNITELFYGSDGGRITTTPSAILTEEQRSSCC